MTTMFRKRRVLALALVCATLIACAQDVATERLRLISVVPDQLFEPWDLARMVPLSEEDWGRRAGARQPAWRPIELDGSWWQGEGLLAKRLNYAAALLRNTSMSVTEIVFDSGLADVSPFSRVFKERFDSSPTAYREAVCGAV